MLLYFLRYGVICGCHYIYDVPGCCISIATVLEIQLSYSITMTHGDVIIHCYKD